MRTGIIGHVDPSIIVSLAAGVILLTAVARSHAVEELMQLVVETGWLYLTNTRG